MLMMLVKILPSSQIFMTTCAVLFLRAARRTSCRHAQLHTTTAAAQRKKMSPHHLRVKSTVLYKHFKDMESRCEARRFVREFPEVEDTARGQLVGVANILQRKGYSWPEVNEHKKLLLLTPSQLNNRFLLLHNLSLPNPTLPQVAYINELMECSIEFLRERGLFRRNTDVFGHFIRRANRDLKLPGEIIEEFCYSYRDNKEATLKEMYIFLLKHYLALRFSKTESEVEEFLNQKCRLLWQWLGGYVRICNLLIDSLGMSFEEVQARPTLLTVDPQNVYRLLWSLPNIGSSATKDLIKKFPKLAHYPYAGIQRWVDLLHTHNVKEFKLTKDALELFAGISFRVVEKRLMMLTELPEWDVIHSSSQLFSILRNDRFMKQVVNMSASEEGITRLHFDLHPQTESRVKSMQAIPSLKQDLTAYLSRHLSVSESRMEELVSEELPSLKCRSLANTMRVLKLLFDFGFTKEQIANGILVFGFESWMVEQTLKDFRTRPNTQPFEEWMHSPFVIHMLVYCICKDNPHFEDCLKNRGWQNVGF